MRFEVDGLRFEVIALVGAKQLRQRMHTPPHARGAMPPLVDMTQAVELPKIFIWVAECAALVSLLTKLDMLPCRH